MKELADIVCFESGSDGPLWTGTTDDLGRDLDPLLNLAVNGLLRIERVDGQLKVSGRDRVGLLLLPSGRRVIIRSKVPSLILLEWLAFLGEFPPLETWLSQQAITVGKDFAVGRDLPACIGRLFLHEIETVTRRFLRKDFLSVRSCSSTVRGRVMTSALRRTIHRLPNVPQLTRTRTIDTVYNIVLAAALDKLPVLLSDQLPNLRGDVARVTDKWAYVERDVTDVASAVTEAQWACPQGYRNAIQLARLILIGAAIDPTSGAGGEVFTLSLAAIWEKSLRRLFRELQDCTGWTLLPDSQRTRRWDDPVGQIDDNRRWMTADVLTQRAGCRWVIDAKYKLGFGDESRIDRFQMCAYAVGFSADRATLAYPTGTDILGVRRLLLSTDALGHPLTVDSVELPMGRGPKACSEAIIALCQEHLCVPLSCSINKMEP